MTLRRLARIVGHRAASIARSSRLDAEVDRELQTHLDALVQEKIAEGKSPEAARRDARLALGNVAALREACRDQRRVGWIHDIGQDVRYGARMLAASPGFTAVAIVSLGLGIGASAGVLGVIAAIRHDSVPAAGGERLVSIRSASLDNPAGMRGVSAADYLAWKERSTAFDAMELSLSVPRDLGDEGTVPAERTTGQAVTAGYLSLLGVEPLMGRVFTGEEARSGARVVILSHALWTRRYGGRSDILNQSIPLDAGRSTVIGVMPEQYRYVNPRIELWTPLHVPPAPPAGARLFGMIASIRPGLTLAGAQADLSAIAETLARERPHANAGWTVEVRPLRDELFGWTREPLLLLLGAVAIVLVMACANVAALLLARGTVRRREIAMRAVLGAGRGRITRQLLTESLLLSAAGGAIGIAIAWLTVRGLSAMTPPIGAPPLVSLGIDLRILAMTAALAAGTGVVFGLVPALTAPAFAPGAPSDGPGSSTVSRRGSALRGGLVTAQIALALTLLIVFGLLANSFVRLEGRDLNFDPSDLLMFEVRTDAPQRVIGQHLGFPYFEMVNVPSQTMARIHERLKILPGIESVAGISFPPVDSLILPVIDVRRDHAIPDDRQASPVRAAYFLVTPGLFHTLRTPLVSGRDFTEADTAASPWVAIVNDAAARQFWPGENPLGRRITIDAVPEEQPREVIGVVGSIPTRHAQLDPQPVIYASYLQQPRRYRGPYGVMFGQMTFVVRGAAPLDLVPAIRKGVAEIERRPISSVMTADARRALGSGRTRYDLTLLATLAGAASLLVAVGVYGLLAYAVSLRTREIGIRKALGAGPNRVIVFIGRHVLGVVLLGVGIGWAGGLAASRLLASRLWGISPTDPSTFLLMAVLVLIVAGLACVVPVRRALVVDPTVALRCE